MMLKEYTFCIAEEYFKIKSESFNPSSCKLINFKEFLVEKNAKPCTLTFIMDLPLIHRSKTSILKNEYISFGIHYQRYIDQDGISYLRVSRYDREYILRASPDYTFWETNLQLTDYLSYYIFNVFFNIAVTARLSYHNTYKIHSSCIGYKGKALTFLGVSGTGKSTHSKLWLKYIEDAHLINDDEPFIKLGDDCKIYVYGAPWSGSTQCYKQTKSVLSAFVHLQQSTHNELQRLNMKDSISCINLSIVPYILGEKDYQRSLNFALDCLTVVPVYRLFCRIDLEAVNLSKSIIDK